MLCFFHGSIFLFLALFFHGCYVPRQNRKCPLNGTFVLDTKMSPDGDISPSFHIWDTEMPPQLPYNNGSGYNESRWPPSHSSHQLELTDGHMETDASKMRQRQEARNRKSSHRQHTINSCGCRYFFRTKIDLNSDILSPIGSFFIFFHIISS